MKKSDLIDQVVERTGHRKVDVTEIVDTGIEMITAALRKHTRVHITGLGIFEPRRRKARAGKNPRTQETIRVPATWSLVFRPSRQLRSAVTGKEARPTTPTTKTARPTRKRA